MGVNLDWWDGVKFSKFFHKLTKVSDAVANFAYPESADFKNYGGTNSAYTYNKNGAMASDSHKGILGIKYNSLNLPQELAVKNINAVGKTYYLYSAGGQKLQTVHKSTTNMAYTPVVGSTSGDSNFNVTTTTDYVGNKVYENGTLKRILVDGGYIENGVYYYYLTDHLGNNRVIANQGGTAVQKNHYYPFGTAFADKYDDGKNQPYKYNGKELDQMHGLNLYDYSARYYESAIGRFTTVDPLAEKYYSISPYAYCNNNPLRFIDPTGMAYSSSDPNQIENMLDHLNNGGSVKNYDYGGWEETEDPEPPEDWPTSPFANTNYTLLHAEQKALNEYSQRAQKIKKAALASLAISIIKNCPLEVQILLATTHAVSVKISMGISAGISSGSAAEGVLITAGDYAGTLVILNSTTKGYALLSMGITLSGTMYTYLGKMENLSPETFQGKSQQLPVSVGNYGGGVSWATDKYGAKLIGRSLSIGSDSFDFPVNAGLEVESSQIKRIIYL